MAFNFYPHPEDTQKGSLEERIELLMEAAHKFKSIIFDDTIKIDTSTEVRRSTPRDLIAAFNWDEIARVLREVRELPEINKIDKGKKGELLAKLADVYEVLRTAKMSKLEAVRLALLNEANHLRGEASQVA